MIVSRKKLFWAVLFVLLCNLAASWRISRSDAQATPRISVVPSEIKDSSKGVGDTFMVEVWIYDADSIGGWQANITFAAAVVSVNSVAEGTFLTGWGFTTAFANKTNNAAGYVQASASIADLPYPPEGGYGDGQLMTVTFEVKAANRGTLLQLVKGTKLNKLVSGTFVPVDNFETEDGSFDNRPIGENQAPVALFDVKPLDASRRGEVGFDASGSSDPDAWLVSYHWDYGDGTQETYMREPLGKGNLTARAIHVFQRNDTFTVTLTVRDNDNATSVASEQATVLFDLAVVNVESPNILVMPGVPVTVNVTVANNGDFYETFNVTAYHNVTLIGMQNVNNMAPRTEQVLTYTWNTTGLELGKYALKANATIFDEETDTGNNEYVDGWVTIASRNVVDFPLLVGGVMFHVVTDSISIVSELSFTPVEKKLSFQAIGQEGITASCNITIPIELLGGNYTVLFNGLPVAPGPQEVTNGTHTFLNFTYTHTTLDMVEIIGETAATPPIAIIIASKTNPLVDELVTLDASSSYDLDGAIVSWTWDFGDGNTASYEIVQHSYSAFGNFTVTLTAEDNKGYIDATEIKIRAIDYPTVRFTYSPTDPLVNKTITFDATTSQPNGGSIMDYSWNFGDGQTGASSNATHAYSRTGMFTVTLSVTDSEGLANSTARTITVTIHDIAITGMATSSNTVEKGETVTVQIVASNRGNYSETFTVTAYYNTTAIEKKSVTELGPGNNQQITVAWNTASIAPGTYDLRAEASTVEEETKTDDNKRTYGSINVRKITSSISISASSTIIALGKNTIIHGILAPARLGARVTVQYRRVGGEWTTLASVTSDAQAAYTLNWRPNGLGTYEVQANWQGDPDTQPCQSTVQTITVQERATSPVLLYAGITIAVVVLAILAIYLIGLRKK